ncbi:6-aminohexanoate hydrolase [Pseudidiomarina sediminum]|uniref:6-aminohexanoate hydrolase n=1 Tax=Pseudidiomarina sediminum TaxID=431675 RepID=A0A432Z995_9GAMM|nr:serine hydrolase [Pseudidiomarina sediminum]RUO74478.1 6-aminohexanoate hydrolase [Pseudidiomarina sediminum]
MLKHVGVVALSGSVILSLGCASANPPLSAEQSDPKVMGWMQGFPPAVDKRVMQPDSNFFSFPKLRWSVCHMRELLPTANVARDPMQASALTYALDDGIESITYTPMGASETLTWQDFLAKNYTDGLLIMHKGQVVYEYTTGCLDKHGKHAAMSMTKSMTGLLAQILVAEGALDENALVSSVIPELEGSGFGDATVRQVMDMTTAIQFSENYADPNADIWTYSRAASPLPKPEGYTGPNGYFEYLPTVQKNGEHGEAFGYRTVNSDVLGWLIARASGQPVHQLLSERIWQPMGAAYDAYMNVDALGTPFAGGGLSANLYDLGRVGQLMLAQGQLGETDVFPREVAQAIAAGGDKKAFAKVGYTTLPGGSYKSMWWVFHNANGAYAARGVHGQTIYIDPTAEMVIVRFASFPQAGNAAIDPTSLPAYQAIADYLVAK